MRISALIVIVSAIAGCGQAESEVEVGVSTSALSAEQAALPHLRVTVQRVDVHVAGGGWATISTTERRLDLFETLRTEADLGTASVPAGRITQLRLFLADDAALVRDGVEQAIACASCTQTGIKMVLAGGHEAEAGERVRLGLAFDARASVVDEGGVAVLRPVILLGVRSRD
jgi:hypothetical protein